MALTVPTIAELRDFANDQDIPDDAYTTILRQQGADVFYLSTGINEDPSDSVEARIAKNAILAMIEFLFQANPTKAMDVSGFTSERIGNYSYSRQVKAAVSGLPTGILFFDLAVLHFRHQPEASMSQSISVFDYDDGMLVQDKESGQKFIFGPLQKADFMNDHKDPSGAGL